MKNRSYRAVINTASGFDSSVSIGILANSGLLRASKATSILMEYQTTSIKLIWFLYIAVTIPLFSARFDFAAWSISASSPISFWFLVWAASVANLLVGAIYYTNCWLDFNIFFVSAEFTNPLCDFPVPNWDIFHFSIFIWDPSPSSSCIMLSFL